MNGGDLTCDLCVIGAGSGGLGLAAGASQLGSSVILVERGLMGGDCLNYGCVPSKALIAAAEAAAAARGAAGFGIRLSEPEIDMAAVRRHIADTIAAIAPNDSVERFQGLGVRVIAAHARFLSSDRLAAGEFRIAARRFVIATGSSPALPPLPGLAEVPHFTNETIFQNAQPLPHLLVLGGGPIGLELAQAYRRLGSQVSVIELDRVLAREDPELVAIVAAVLRREGVGLHEGTRAVAVTRTDGGVSLSVTGDAGGNAQITGTHLLVATGRQPNVETLGLEAAGVAYDRRGILVDRRLRTSNRRIFAIGDVAGGPQFTHVAGYHAGIVIRNALFRLPAKVDEQALPRAMYTKPELAQVGLQEQQARQQGHDIVVLRWPFARIDRATAERRTEGLVKVVASKRGRVLGVGIVGPHAADLLQPWQLAIANGLKLGQLARLVPAYPSYGEASQRAAGEFFAPKLFAPRTRALVAWLRRLG